MPIIGWPTIQNSRLPDLHKTEAGHQRPLRRVAVANDLAMTVLVVNVPMNLNPLGYFGFNGFAEQTLGAVAKNAA